MLILELPKETTTDKQLEKVNEEYEEFVQAIVDGDTNEEVVSEFYDVVQAMIGVLDLKDIKKDEIANSGFSHTIKLVCRGWKFKGAVDI
ncbi:hypothetical protein [Metaclostridioides mangenotii]|uniref:hypothetical protein n=1 Tax=Metaclostridioides mangenotii TaxID=1540 RepID=UPI0028E7E9F9|nr:hypothetical protein [Clostridioides mangenotii]